MPQFSLEQQREIMREARENVRKRDDTAANRADVLRRAHENAGHARRAPNMVYKTRDDARVADEAPVAADARAAPVVAKPWWEWVQEHVDHRLEVFAEDVGEVIGVKTQETL